MFISSDFSFSILKQYSTKEIKNRLTVKKIYILKFLIQEK